LSDAPINKLDKKLVAAAAIAESSATSEAYSNLSHEAHSKGI
jgi:hypothetical protein